MASDRQRVLSQRHGGDPGLRCPEQGEGAGKAKLNGYLEDYAYLIEGLLELYQTTFEPKWFVAAQELAETMIAHFQASEGGFLC